MTPWQMECAARKRYSWKVFWAGFAMMVFTLLLAFSAVSPANASARVAGYDEIKASQCVREVYRGLTGMADENACASLLYLPTSATFKCSLYIDSGYPSRLMRKACQLFETGYIETFINETPRANK